MKKLIPDEMAWEGYQNDLDAMDFHRFAFGKSIDDIQEYFSERGSLRFDEMERLPRPVFQYYIFGFAKFVTSSKAKNDSDSASIFLALLETREKEDCGCVCEIYGYLAATVDFIANNQQHFDADIEIYGSFKARAEVLRQTCKAYVNR